MHTLTARKPIVDATAMITAANYAARPTTQNYAENIIHTRVHDSCF